MNIFKFILFFWKLFWTREHNYSHKILIFFLCKFFSHCWVASFIRYFHINYIIFAHTFILKKLIYRWCMSYKNKKRSFWKICMWSKLIVYIMVDFIGWIKISPLQKFNNSYHFRDIIHQNKNKWNKDFQSILKKSFINIEIIKILAPCVPLQNGEILYSPVRRSF